MSCVRSVRTSGPPRTRASLGEVLRVALTAVFEGRRLTCFPMCLQQLPPPPPWTHKSSFGLEVGQRRTATELFDEEPSRPTSSREHRSSATPTVLAVDSHLRTATQSLKHFVKTPFRVSQTLVTKAQFLLGTSRHVMIRSHAHAFWHRKKSCRLVT